MARMRSLRPDYFLREDMADVSLEAHFLLAGLAVLADRDGRLLDRPRTIKAQVFPFREVDIEAALAELVAVGVVARYAAGGKAVIALLTWDADQTPHHKETSFGLPSPPSTNDGQPSRKVAVPPRSVPLGVGVGVGVGVGSRDGCGNGSLTASRGASAPDAGEDLPDATAHVVECPPERPALVLAPSPPDVPEKAASKPEKAPRKPKAPSPGVALYAALEAARAEHWKAHTAAHPTEFPECVADPEDGWKRTFVADGWSYSRQETQLGPHAKRDDVGKARFEAAFGEYLADPTGATREPPWSVGWFIACLATYEARAVKSQGVAS